jgi:hypothetical protein
MGQDKEQLEAPIFKFYILCYNIHIYYCGNKTLLRKLILQKQKEINFF